MRIATGSFTHESSTFTTVETTRDSFHTQRFGYLRGGEVLERFDGTNSAVGGFLAGCREHGYELIPTICAGAAPSAPVPRAVFDEILGDMLIDETYPEIDQEDRGRECAEVMHRLRDQRPGRPDAGGRG